LKWKARSGRKIRESEDLERKARPEGERHKNNAGIQNSECRNAISLIILFLVVFFAGKFYFCRL
jgi:hypothetical protein